MSVIDAIILGIIQGLTEFLPVSSSGHLELGKTLLGEDALPEESLLFTVVVHFATALSTVIIFRKDVADILRGLFKFRYNTETQFSLKIIVSMVPAALVGIIFESEIEELFSGQILLVGAMLIITGLLLFLADRARLTGKSVSYRNACIIGIAQAISIMPGISRSGATISTTVLLGVDREKAARFSFLMVVPLILGKVAKDLMDGNVTANEQMFLPLTFGFLAAFIAGLFACKVMITLVKRSQLTWFAIYCFVVGTLAMGWSWYYM